MARPKSWIGNMPSIIKVLEESIQAHYSRQGIEILFGIGKSAASELMNTAGIAGYVPPEGGHFVSRANLLAYVKNCPEALAAEQETRRRKKLAEAIQKASGEVQLRSIPLPVTTADEWARFQDLPNVSISGGLLTVAFSSPEDLMGQLYRLCKAAGNEWTLFAKLCAPQGAPPDEKL
jgi:hypothetical protein